MTASTRRWSLAASGRSQLPEDAPHVLLDGPLGDPQGLRDPRVGAPLSHQGQHLAFAGAQPVQGVVAPLVRRPAPGRARGRPRSRPWPRAARFRRSRRRRRRGSSAGTRCRVPRREVSSRARPRHAPRAPGWPRRGTPRGSSLAASSPSTVWVGGIRMSTSTRSGTSSRTRSRRALESPACPTTSKPGRAKRLANPARRRTSSSATTTRSVSSAGRSTSRAPADSAPGAMPPSMDRLIRGRTRRRRSRRAPGSLFNSMSRG